MLDKISNAYDRLISSYLRRFTPITVPGDWHLRLEWLPCWKPEVVYDIDHREGIVTIILTRFLEIADQGPQPFSSSPKGFEMERRISVSDWMFIIL